MSDIETSIEKLIASMTMDEKVGQLVQYSHFEELTGPGQKAEDVQTKINEIKSGRVGSILNAVNVESTRKLQELALSESAHGIPLIFGYDVIHGFKTMFPVPLGESASWDMDLIELSASIAAKEAASSGVHWTFAPMVDVSRDARWGRIMEGAGEDVYLNSRIAEARVRGFQGEDLGDSLTVAACAKHFAGYGFGEAGRDYNTVDISDHALHNIVLPPFKACVDAGVATVMNAFNDLSGVPATGHEGIQREILKNDWGFDGFVVSDWGSIDQMIGHGFASDKRDAARIAMNAGSDMDMEGYCYQTNLMDLVKEGSVDEEHIDDAVRRILRIKYELGIMDDPFKYCSDKRESENVYTQEHLDACREIGRSSIVLLKNDGGLLPIGPSVRSIAVIGPLGDDKDSPLGNWRAQAIPNSAVSLIEGITEAAGKAISVKFEKGCELVTGERSFGTELQFNTTDKSGFAKAISLARSSDLVIMAIGEDCYQSGEGRSQVDIGLSGLQQELFDAVASVNSNIVTVLMNGRPLAIPEVAQRSAAIVEAWHLGSQAGHAIADVLYGKYNPSGKLPVSFPRSVGQCPLYYARMTTGRGDAIPQVFWSHYTDEHNDALFPFGHGLSYTQFEMSPPKLSSTKMGSGETINVSLSVTNSGEMDGHEVVQLYIRDIVATRSRPAKELKAFRKVFVKARQTEEVTFELTEEDLKFYSPEEGWIAEDGEFQIFIGNSSVNTISTKFELIKS